MSRRPRGARPRPEATAVEGDAPAPVAGRRVRARTDAACLAALLVVTLAVYAPALFAGRVLLPADVVPLMRPWAATARERFPDLTFAQNQMLGPIFEYYSWRDYARGQVRAGVVPLWNPNEMSGNVFLANSQSAVLYPPNVLLYVFSLPVGINLVTALHTFLAGAFMFGLLRSLGLRPAAALTGGLAWMLCGTLTVWTEFQTPTAALCWLPAALWCWERFHGGAGWRWAVLGSGAAVALALVAGHVQFAFYVILGLVLYAFVRSVWPGRCTSRPLAVASLAAAIAFGVVLSMATMLPVIEAGRHNFRGRHANYAASTTLRLPLPHLLTLVNPGMYGDPRNYISFDAAGVAASGHPYFGKYEYIEYAAYPGAAALTLALAGLALSLRRRGQPAPGGVAALAVIALVGLLLALGTPLGAVLFYGVPGYRQFNAPARSLCMLSFGLAALAAHGVEALARAREAGDRRSVAMSLLAGCAAVAMAALASYPVALTAASQSAAVRADLAPFADVYSKWSPYLLRGALTGVGFAGIAAVVALAAPCHGARGVRLWLQWSVPAVVAADLAWWGAGFNPMPPRGMLGWPTEVGTRLRATPPDRVASLEAPGGGIKSRIVPNYNLVVGYREAQGADSLHTRRYHALMEAVTRRLSTGGAGFADPNTVRFPPSLDHPVFDMLNVRHATTAEGSASPGPGYRAAGEAELALWENTRAYGSVWMVGRAQQSGPDDTLEALVACHADTRAVALLDEAAPTLDSGATGSSAWLVSHAPHRIEAEVEARGRGLVVFSETAYPGWRATVDGRPTPVLTANLVLRAVPVPPGTHRVALVYEPASWRVGLYLTLASLMAAGALLAGRRTTSAVPGTRGHGDAA